MANATSYLTPFGTFELERYPLRRSDPLQAWCAADSLLLDAAQRCGIPSTEFLVVNDSHGALCTALQPCALWTDSALATLALQHNEEANNREPTPIASSIELPPAATAVALRIPKQLAYFEYQLSCLAQSLPADATVLAAGMDKHLSPRTADLLQRYIGPTERHPGKHKARVFSAMRDPAVNTLFQSEAWYDCEPLQQPLLSLPNSFSRESLDLGARFLLEFLPQLEPVDSAIDLACGNGVLGLSAYQRGVAKSVMFCDESAQAVASAARNSEQLFPEDSPNFSFHYGDGLKDYQGPPVQLILCNPPFHSEHTVDEFAGRHLLAHCAKHLTPTGQLCVVANRHLNYVPVLKRSFKSVEQVAQNAKFVILLAKRGV